MEKTRALGAALDITKVVLAASDGKLYPRKDSAESVADFIETLTKRLEKMDLPES